MDDTATNMIERETDLANFDHARDDFEDALLAVPGNSLEHKPEGDDYSVADLVPHITHALQLYTDVVLAMREAEFREIASVAAPDHDARLERHRKARSETTTAQGHASALEEMRAVHDRLASMLREISLEEFTRKTPVRYPGTEEQYPTSASDIIGWVTDHYREHAQQVAEMLNTK